MNRSSSEESFALAPSRPVRLALLWNSSIGKKVLMATTGLVLFSYVLGHLLGNLQIYVGSETIDAYARFLRSVPVLLWVVRVILLATALVHAVLGLILTVEKQRARPIPYLTRANIQASLPSRTMFWSGLAILLFVLFHVFNLTLGVGVPGYVEIRPSVNVPAVFRIGWMSAVYVAAMVGVGVHLWHGLYSMFQSIGFGHPRYTPGLRAAAALVGTLVALGNISIPVAGLTGFLG